MASDVIANAGSEIRENLVTTAVKFLQNPNVQRCTVDSKQRFLRSKGLSDLEIQKAIDKCMETLDVPSMTSELMFFHQSRRSWVRDHVVPILAYCGVVYGCYWFYKNCIRHLLFVEDTKRKSTAECIDELRRSLDVLNASVTSLRTEMQTTAQHSAMRSQLDNIKSDIASVKGILLNRNQFPGLKGSIAPSIPSWQRQAEEATSTEPVEEKREKKHRRGHRSESGSNSSEGEQATKNSDSSLEIIS